MPSVEAHDQKYSSNMGVAENLYGIQNPPYDWIVTVYFYAALHLVEKKLAPLGVHAADHRERNEKVRKLFRKISVYYESLYLESQNARYDCIEITPGKANLAKNHLEKIREYLEE
ncbi:hypothetical protein [Paenibacillus sp. GCM10027626]|uniref:hypothetical protein n=1 Tax=Paenibacillus sp. GCM10027626 TaxID=3273411 RepID=UPI003630C94D